MYVCRVSIDLNAVVGFDADLFSTKDSIFAPRKLPHLRQNRIEDKRLMFYKEALIFESDAPLSNF